MTDTSILTHSIGDHIILGVHGSTLSEADTSLLKRIKPIGIMLLDRNFNQSSYRNWIESLKKLLDSVYTATQREKMLITIDHEGGRWMRAPVPITKFPAAINYRENSYAIGKAKGTEIRSLGCNLSFAPICDIHSNPNNPVIGARAFGTTPEEVSKYVIPYSQGLQESNILTCAKHFPGHGDTNTDSHYELPIVDLDEESLACREFKPFQNIASTADSLMTAHVLYPKLDEVPATMSKKILKHICREKIGFENVIISDDLEMKAILPYLEKDAIVNSIVASVDIFIISRYWGIEIAEELHKKYNCVFENPQSENIERSLLESRTRILKLLSQAKRFEPALLDRDTLMSHYELALGCIM